MYRHGADMDQPGKLSEAQHRPEYVPRGRMNDPRLTVM